MFTLTITLDNAAFGSGAQEKEVARILRDVATRIERGHIEGSLRDSNGNTVGNWRFV